MRFVSVSGVAAAIVLFCSAGGLASAETCEATEFDSNEAGRLYVSAEYQLLQRQKPKQALQALNQMLAMELNCYELRAGQRLKLAILINTENAKKSKKDYSAAIALYVQMIEDGTIPEGDRADAYYSIIQLHLKMDDFSSAENMYPVWLQNGGVHTRDTKYQLSMVYAGNGHFGKAAELLADVVETDGDAVALKDLESLYQFYIRAQKYERAIELLNSDVMREHDVPVLSKDTVEAVVAAKLEGELEAYLAYVIYNHPDMMPVVKCALSEAKAVALEDRVVAYIEENIHGLSLERGCGTAVYDPSRNGAQLTMGARPE